VSHGWIFRNLAAPAIVALGVQLPALANKPDAMVRLWELQIVPQQSEAFHARAREHIEATLREEPRVLAIHSAVEKENPSRVRVFEMYTDEMAYRSHLQTPHFGKFRDTTDRMMTARKMHETTPILLGAKPNIPRTALVRIAELQIDPSRLEDYKAAVIEEINDSIRLEAGVLAIYCVALKDQPSHLRFFEIYADEGAYRAHIASPHFRKYVEVTKAMIKARKLYETESVILGAK
jgi:quinol monooxygenase YgiN